MIGAGIIAILAVPILIIVKDPKIKPTAPPRFDPENRRRSNTNNQLDVELSDQLLAQENSTAINEPSQVRFEGVDPTS